MGTIASITIVAIKVFGTEKLQLIVGIGISIEYQNYFGINSSLIKTKTCITTISTKIVQI